MSEKHLLSSSTLALVVGERVYYSLWFAGKPVRKERSSEGLRGSTLSKKIP